MKNQKKLKKATEIMAECKLTTTPEDLEKCLDRHKEVLDSLE